MTQDLIARLRAGEWWHTVTQGPNPTSFTVDATPDAHDAANLIERQARVIEEAREALAEIDYQALCYLEAALETGSSAGHEDGLKDIKSTAERALQAMEKVG